MKSDNLSSKERNIFQNPRLSETLTNSHLSANTRHTTGEFQKTDSVAIQRVTASLQAINKHRSPLQSLQESIATFFVEGPHIASFIFKKFWIAAIEGDTSIDVPKDIILDPLDLKRSLPWNSCKQAATLVLLFACPHNNLFEALKFLSRTLGGLPTLSLIRTTPTSSFAQAFAKAKKAALSGEMATTVIGVSLIDVHIFELNVRDMAKPYSSFAHAFVVGVGPEGVVIWQSWGEHRYPLDEYLAGDGARVRSWDEAEES